MRGLLLLVPLLLAMTAIQPERDSAWQAFATVTRDAPTFARWFNESDVFSDDTRAAPALPFPGQPIGATADAPSRLAHIGDAPIVTFVHYNEAAYRHIRSHRLEQDARLRALATTGEIDPEVPAMRRIPPFPADATVMMTGWWPIAAREPTPLPVWDAPAHGAGDYVNWRRVVAVAASPQGRPGREMLFAGRRFPAPRRIAIARFPSIAVDAAMAGRLMADPGSRKAILIALERPIEPGDRLVLVAMHLLSFAKPGGVWATFWWHDQPTAGRFAQGRPVSLPAPWTSFRMDTAIPGNPRACFNPWFEARFPDGERSNCIACHARASYPRTDFLPIRRGNPDHARDPAFAAGRLRTGGLWSLANPGAPAPQSIR